MKKSPVILTLDLLEIEFARVAEVCGTKSFKLHDYQKHSKDGYRAASIKNQLGFTVNQVKEKLGYPLLLSGFAQGITKRKPVKSGTPKVFCKRGEGSMINWNTGCFPGNDACLTYPHPNESNRMSHTLTKEEEDMDKFTINTQGGYGVSQGSLA